MSVSKRVELGVKELLKHPNKNSGYYSFTTGVVAELSEPWQRLQQSKGYKYKLTPDPADTVACTLDDLYEYEVDVFFKTSAGEGLWRGNPTHQISPSEVSKAVA